MLILVIVFAAAPLSLIEQVLNLALDGFEYGVNLLLSFLSWLANLIGAGLYGVLSAAQNWLSVSLEAVGVYLPSYSMLWTNVVWAVSFTDLSFASLGINTAFSPIGTVVSAWITDPAAANLLGGAGLAATVLLLIMVVLKR